MFISEGHDAAPHAASSLYQKFAGYGAGRIRNKRGLLAEGDLDDFWHDATTTFKIEEGLSTRDDYHAAAA